MNNFYDFKAINISWKEIEMSEFKNKLILVVNTASKCWLTPQYEWLEELYKKYKDSGFVVLWFPCNQFWNQESWDENSIKQWCLLNYWVSFPMFSKIDVNWEKAHEIFKYLKNKLPWFITSDIKWNFTKFLIDKNWTPIKRFAPTTNPKDIEKIILEYLEK